MSESPFVASVRPIVGQLRLLVEAASDSAGVGLPASNSRAMAELHWLASQQYLQETVEAAHSLAGVLRFAAGDYVRQFTRLFDDLPVPVYAHLSLARAGLEAAASSYWLVDTDIGAEARAHRYQALRAKSGLELRRSPIREQKLRGLKAVQQVKADCQRLGWDCTIKEREVVVADEALPGGGNRIERLVSAGVPGRNGLGMATWWYLSGVDHGITYALLDGMEVSDQESISPPPVSPVFGTFATHSGSVLSVASLLGHAFITLFDAHLRLFGWDVGDWNSVRAEMINKIRWFTQQDHSRTPMRVPNEVSPDAYKC